MAKAELIAKPIEHLANQTSNDRASLIMVQVDDNTPFPLQLEGCWGDISCKMRNAKAINDFLESENVVVDKEVLFRKDGTLYGFIRHNNEPYCRHIGSVTVD